MNSRRRKKRGFAAKEFCLNSDAKKITFKSSEVLNNLGVTSRGTVWKRFHNPPWMSIHCHRSVSYIDFHGWCLLSNRSLFYDQFCARIEFLLSLPLCKIKTLWGCRFKHLMKFDLLQEEKHNFNRPWTAKHFETVIHSLNNKWFVKFCSFYDAAPCRFFLQR